MNSQRRDLLKLSPLALAGFAPTLAMAQTKAQTKGKAMSPMMFDVRNFGAAGTGKVLDTSYWSRAAKETVMATADEQTI